MGELAPSVQTIRESVDALTIAADATPTVGEVPIAGNVSSVTYTPNLAMTGAASHYRTLNLINKGQAGLGTAVIATFAFSNTGYDGVAFDELPLNLAGTKQVETATVVGTITGAGNATVIVTAPGMSGTPITLSVAVALADTASQVAEKIRAAMAANANIAAWFTIAAAGAVITLTKKVAAADAQTMNISVDNGTCTGLTQDLTSTHTVAGAAGAEADRAVVPGDILALQSVHTGNGIVDPGGVIAIEITGTVEDALGAGARAQIDLDNP